jgi:hypothetical protein
MKKQVVFIHGDSTFDTYEDYLEFLKNLDVDLDRYRKVKWRDSLRQKLGDGFDILLPKMPGSMNAKYSEWEILFKKISHLLDNNVILVGHSLGAIFLVKYLSENIFPKNVLATFLIAPPYDDEGLNESLGGFTLTGDLSKLNSQAGKIFMYFSKDDPVVPFSHLKKYKKELPNAVVREFEDRGHFSQPEFPELIENIKNL